MQNENSKSTISGTSVDTISMGNQNITEKLTWQRLKLECKNENKQIIKQQT